MVAHWLHPWKDVLPPFLTLCTNVVQLNDLEVSTGGSVVHERILFWQSFDSNIPRARPKSGRLFGGKKTSALCVGFLQELHPSH
jgi:hypothetical protein